MKIEICANSFASAVAAQDARADRIELCTELAIGGLTPSHGLLKKVIEELSIPTHALIRPRSGDFTYSEDELDVMLKDIKYCKEIGCTGIVSGVLTKNKAGEIIIDQNATARLIKASTGMEFTFHRAFDWVNDPVRAIDQLSDMGVARLLTSGQKPTAIEGIDLLKKVKSQVNRFRGSDKIPLQIMPGGGINAENAFQFKNAGFEAVHFSATRKEQKLDAKPKVPFHSDLFFEEGIVATSDIEKIRAVKKAIQHPGSARA